jgi:hypothetical protein
MLETPSCYLRKCKHFIGAYNPSEPFEEKYEVVICKAFPLGIPDDIANGKNKHLTPVEGDRGIVYEHE